MARPLKNGLDYFSHDVDLSSDFKIEFLEAKHGITGYGVYIKLLERIYRDGYFLKWDEKTALITASKVNVDIKSMSDMINDCIAVGLFSQKMFDKYSILTSAGIQKRYLKGCIRRKQVFVIQEYLLIEIIADKNNKQEVVNVDKSTQSKVNRKESKKKGKNISGFSEEFEAWWKIYPPRKGRKVGKQLAANLFNKLPKKYIPELMTGTENYSLECNGLPKDGHRFLRERLWKDYLTARPAQSKNANSRSSSKKTNRSVKEIREAMTQDSKGALILDWKKNDT